MFGCDEGGQVASPGRHQVVRKSQGEKEGSQQSSQLYDSRWTLYVISVENWIFWMEWLKVNQRSQEWHSNIDWLFTMKISRKKNSSFKSTRNYKICSPFHSEKYRDNSVNIISNIFLFKWAQLIIIIAYQSCLHSWQTGYFKNLKNVKKLFIIIITWQTYSTLRH